jgi:hypothetical protein
MFLNAVLLPSKCNRWYKDLDLPAKLRIRRPAGKLNISQTVFLDNGSQRLRTIKSLLPIIPPAQFTLTISGLI